MAQSCPNGCENTIGSYRCVESSDVEIFVSNVDVTQTTEINAPVKACGDGLRFDSNNNCEGWLVFNIIIFMVETLFPPK